MTAKEKWVVGGILFAILTIITFTVLVEIETVHGNEIAVLETWGGGVDDQVYQPKTYIRFPGFLYTFYPYDMSSQVYVMNDLASTVEFAQGREKDSYKVQSTEGQDMRISMNVRWRLDPDKLVHLHKTVRENFEEKILRPALLRTVKDHSTVMEAIAAYSGAGLVELQSHIQQALADKDGIVRQQGLVVENFVIEGIELDEKYIGEIRARQVAIQAELRAHQEEKAALAEANKAEAEAQADLKRQVVAAERDKQVGILAAEKAKQERVLAAEADKQEQVLKSEGERLSGENKAAAIVAIGDAEAHAKQVQLEAWAVDGAENFVKIEIAKSMAQAFENINGYLPGDMNITMLSSNFMSSLRAVMNGDSSELGNLDPSLAKRRIGGQ